jgi:hypothetical protein
MARQIRNYGIERLRKLVACAAFEPVGQQRRYWLDYDPVALAVLVIGIGLIEVLALII